MKTYTFRVIIEPDEKNTFHGYVPVLVGCHTWENSLEETKKKLKEAIAVYVEDLVKEGEKIPQEKSFESFETINLDSKKVNYA